MAGAPILWNYAHSMGVNSCAGGRSTPVLLGLVRLRLIEQRTHPSRQFSLIVNYDLSRRTRLYAVASRLINQNTAAYRMTGASFTASQALSPDAGASETGVQLGIRHTF